MIEENNKIEKINNSKIFNKILPGLSNLLCHEDDSLAVMLFDMFDFEINLVDVEKYIAVPVECQKYSKPVTNPNFYTELSSYILENCFEAVSTYDIEQHPRISLDIQVNMFDIVGEYEHFKRYTDSSYLTDYFTNFYFLKVIEIFNHNNIKFIKNDIFPKIEKYINSLNYREQNTELYDKMIANCKYNCELKNDFLFESFKSVRNVDNDIVFLKEAIDNKKIFDVSILSFQEQIKISDIVNHIHTFDDSVYFNNLLNFNIESDIFLGHCSKHLYDIYRDYSNGQGDISDGLFLFVYKGLEAFDKTDFDNKFPNLSEIEVSIVEDFSFPNQVKFFKCVMPHIV